MQTWLIKPAFIPIATRTPSSTAAPACQANSSIDSENSTGGSLTFNLYGPSDFYFWLGSWRTTLKVHPGSCNIEA